MDIRSEFLNFFQKKGHQVYASMPLVPDDPTLLFTNAGMVQFKDIFTGKIPTPSIPRATSSQLCIRAGGKHNDLENVGFTRRHHTLFEMLGNFSFGDYFKEDAIAYAWEFVTKILGFDESVLFVTVHQDDEESFKIWSKHINPQKIKRMGDKDNFWQMGDTGPCGPCSEIFVDQGESFDSSEDYFGGDGDRFLEIWNLVFMQFERHSDGSLTPLPKPSIDTGMGLERVTALLEKKKSNFDSSLFMPLIQEVEKITKKPYIYEEGASYRVIADHARSVAFLLAQGTHFDKEGRGYVLRRILRRALRHGYLLGITKPFLYQVVQQVCIQMSKAYPYLLQKQEVIVDLCKLEESRFFETLESGITLFKNEVKAIKEKHQDTLPGEVAFKLYDTFGFPLDITEDMLKEEGLKLDINGFEISMKQQRELARSSWKGSGDSIKEGDFKAILAEFGENIFVGYETDECQSEILALFDENFKRVEELSSLGYVLLAQTPFYPESGGPIGDKGFLANEQQDPLAQVEDTKKYFGLNISQIKPSGCLHEKQKVWARVNDERIEIAKHHSATHLLHFALRQKFGDTITQAGSLVEPHRLRFDFSFSRALTQEELIQIQDEVNVLIFSALDSKIQNMPLEEAQKIGAIALFSEKYNNEVRVVSFGDKSCELCGGIHVKNTSLIGNFFITKESGVSSGVRRIEAICGKAGYHFSKQLISEENYLKELLKTQNLSQGVLKLKDKIKELEKSLQAKQGQTKLEPIEINNTKVIVQKIQGEIKSLIDENKNRYDKIAILLINEKLQIVAGCKNINLQANDWAKKTAQVLGGNGGGRSDFATAGGKDPSRIDEALKKALEFAKLHLSNQ